MPELEQILADPAWYPEQIDLKRRVLRFCPMNLQTYGQSAFLDHRIIRGAGHAFELPLDTAVAIGRTITYRRGHFVFHSAFCCSTLLSRYLERVDRLLVLREPHSLYEAGSILRFYGTPLEFPFSREDWRPLFRFISALLTRTFSSSQISAIKPTDGCSNLMAELMATHPDHLAVLVFVGLERFLASVLRTNERREWARIRVRELLLDRRGDPWTRNMEPSSMEDWRAATLVWLLHMDSFRKLLAAYPCRVRCVNGQMAVERPRETLKAICTHFGTKISLEQVTSIVDTVSCSGHAKAPATCFDGQSRDLTYAKFRREHAPEIASALRWADQVSNGWASTAPVPQESILPP